MSKEPAHTLKSKWSLPYNRQLLIYSILLSVIPVLLFGLISSTFSKRAIQHEVDEKQQLTLQQLKYQVDTFLYNIEFASLQITNDMTIEKSLDVGISMDNPVALQTTLDMLERVKNYRSYSDINYDVTLVYNKYDYVYSSRYGIIPLLEFPYRSIIEALPKVIDRYVVVPPKVYPDQEQLILVRPIQSTAAPAKGLLVMEVDAKRFYQFFQSLKLSHGSQLMIIDHEGRIVMSQNETQIGSKFHTLVGQDLEPFLGNGPGTIIQINDTRYRLSLEQSSMNQWTYMALTPMNELMQKSRALSQMTWLFVAGLAIIWTIISFFGSRKMFDPLKHLAVKINQQSKQKHDVLQTIDDYIQRSQELTQKLQEEMNNRLPGMKEYVFLQLLNGEISEQSFLEQANKYDIPLGGKYYYVCVIAIDQFIEFKQKYIGRDRALMMYALSKTIQEICEEHQPCFVVSQETAKFAFIYNANSQDSESEMILQQICDKIRDKIDMYFGWSVTISFCRARDNLKQIHSGYLEAQELHHLSFWIGKNRTIFNDNLDHMEPTLLTYRALAKNKKLLLSRLAEGDLEAAEAQFSHIVTTVLEPASNSPQANSFFVHLIGDVDSILEESGTDLVRLFGDEIYQWVYSHKSIAEYTEWFQQTFFPKIRQYLGSLNPAEKQSLIRQTTQYVQQHFESDLSLQLVAEQLNVQSYNLSRYFKEVMDMNFIDYVIMFRMNKAKEWLTYSDMSIKEIAERLRYASTQNFTRVFKQMTGIPPGKYRLDQRNQGN
ncbi:helix-turn-helix domain-containing protein [Paenibacillus sp. GCM10027626]|uniref:helix-turn-helix domain-containing protein n=1 Tax=Paenibacillus sp. GCM10027626 TaxID=3273411 RepID=UPI0036366665